MTIIKSIELTPVFVPFAKEVLETMKSSDGGLGMAIAAEEEWTGGDFVICRLVADTGETGIGEAFVWLPETGVSPEQLIESIKKSLGRYVIGKSPFNVEQIRHQMEINVNRSDVAKGLIDMACYDMMGRITERSACDFMGGRCLEKIPIAALIPLLKPKSMVELCELFYSAGMRTFRLKLGKNLQCDVDIVSSIRKELGQEVRLRVDYNQAYTPPDAVRAIKAIEPYGIDVVEQPVAATNYAGMVYVQERVDVPIMAHEGCFSLQDISTLVQLGAIKTIGLNSERPGGVTNMLRALSYADMMGMGAVLHNQTLGIASAMHIHVAAARFFSLGGHAIELFGHIMLENDMIINDINYDNGTATVPNGPGWGVELDEEALKKYATGKTIIIDANSY